MSAAAPVLTGILVLNHHHPEETALCVASFLAREPASSRILWLESEADRTGPGLLTFLAAAPFPWALLDPDQGALPPAGTVAVILCRDNLGYAGANNVGLRCLHRLGVPYAWVLNNDTLLSTGDSTLLVAAARARPEVGAWSTLITSENLRPYLGGILNPLDFTIAHVFSTETLEHPLAYASGCSLFLPLAAAAAVGFLPEEYFLYYEDVAFSFLLKRAGFRIAGVPAVAVSHAEALSTGLESPLRAYYILRNRWLFIARFCPWALPAQRRRLWYTLQKNLVRRRVRAAWLEWMAYRDYNRGSLGKTLRVLPATPIPGPPLSPHSQPATVLPPSGVRVGIVVLNYHQPAATLACVRRLLAVEGPATRILWVENDAGLAGAITEAALTASGLPWVALEGQDPLPPAGTLGVIFVPANSGYGAGNNAGLRFLHARGVPYAWVLNNDTLLEQGASADLVAAAEARPEVGLWGTAILSGAGERHCGGEVQARDFAVRMRPNPADLADNPMAFVSGCSMFLRTDTARAAGWIPESYFLYYEDLAFSWEIRRLGLQLAALDCVAVTHLEGLSTGQRSASTEFYNRRNRWYFIQRYFPERLRGQQWQFLLYQVQKRLFALQFRKLSLEWRAWRAFNHGNTGPLVAPTHTGFQGSSPRKRG